MGRGKVGGTLAVVLSSLWGLASLSITAIGVLVVVSGRNESELDIEGLVEFVGGVMALVGGAALVCSIAGIYFGVRMRRGQVRPIGTPLLFGVFAAVSGLFLASAISVESGPEPFGIALWSLNTAACVFILVAAVGSRAAS